MSIGWQLRRISTITIFMLAFSITSFSKKIECFSWWISAILSKEYFDTVSHDTYPSPCHCMSKLRNVLGKIESSIYDFFIQMVYLYFRILIFFPSKVRLFFCSFIVITEVESNSKDQGFGFSGTYHYSWKKTLLL